MSVPALTFSQGGWCNALGRSYARGRYQPKSMEEYEALAPHAGNAGHACGKGAAPPPPAAPAASAPSIDLAKASRDELMAYARELGLKPSPTLSNEKLRAMAIGAGAK